MCIAIPGKVTKLLDEYTAMVDFGGVERKVNLDLITGSEEIIPGLNILVHVGYAISIISEDERKEISEILEQLENDE